MAYTGTIDEPVFKITPEVGMDEPSRERGKFVKNRMDELPRRLIGLMV